MEWTKLILYIPAYDIVFEADSSFAQIDKKIKLEWERPCPYCFLLNQRKSLMKSLKIIRIKYALGFEQLMEEYTRLMQDSKRKLGLE